jgi:hypothetical protein
MSDSEDTGIRPDSAGDVPKPDLGEPTREAAVPGAAEPRREGGRSARTRPPLWPKLVAAIAVVAVLIVGYFGITGYERVRAAQEALDEAASLLESAEDDVLVIDAATLAEVSSEVETSAADALALVEGVRGKALEASRAITEIRPDLPEELIGLAEALGESASARVEMMDAAPVVLEADIAAARAMVAADGALAEVKAAETLVTKGVAEFNKHTAAGVKASGQYSTEAEAKLNVAKSLFTSATAEFPGADYSAFIAYVDAKIGLIAEARKIDSLWLAGKVEQSNSQLAAYNKKDAEIVKMAEALPESVRDPIADAYEKATAEAAKSYFEARERARAAGERVTEIREELATEE